MRINKYVAQSSGLSRRAADAAIAAGRVLVNGQRPEPAYQTGGEDRITLDGRAITRPVNSLTIMLNKPPGYVVSRVGQGSRTIYDLLPENYQLLQPVGRLDKDSSGLLLLTNDGQLANQLTHPRYAKTKIYEVELDKPLAPLHQQMIVDIGVTLADGRSRLGLTITSGDRQRWQVAMQEGRNRQIRRTFEALGYRVSRLHRITFGPYNLNNLKSGQVEQVEP